MKPTGQNPSPSKRDNETLAAAIKRYENEKAERELLLVNQGKLEGGLDEIQDDSKS